MFLMDSTTVFTIKECKIDSYMLAHDLSVQNAVNTPDCKRQTGMLCILRLKVCSPH